MNKSILTAIVAGITATGLLAFPLNASAATLTQETSTEGQIIFQKELNIPKFDNALGNLKNILVELSGMVSGVASVQNLDATAQNITTNLVARLQLTSIPNNDIDLTIKALGSITENFAPDELKTYNGLQGSASTSKSFDENQILDLFKGSGNALFSLKAGPSFNDPDSESFADGRGGLFFDFDTFAKANLKVTYEYDPAIDPTQPVPEPSSGLGLIIIAGIGAIWSQKSLKMNVVVIK
jgi:hypothetical protein